MKAVCSECDRMVFVPKRGRLENHDLCAQHWRSLRGQLVASRWPPKPDRAVRSTLKLMQQDEAERAARRN